MDATTHATNTTRRTLEALELARQAQSKGTMSAKELELRGSETLDRLKPLGDFAEGSVRWRIRNYFNIRNWNRTTEFYERALRSTTLKPHAETLEEKYSSLFKPPTTDYFKLREQ
jgi:hypothetical protein